MSTPQAPPHTRPEYTKYFNFALLFFGHYCFVLSLFVFFTPLPLTYFRSICWPRPVTSTQQNNGSRFGNSRVVDVLHVKKLSNNFKSSIPWCSCDKYGVSMYKLRSRAAASVQRQNVTPTNSKTPEILLALAQYAPEYVPCWETCVFLWSQMG